MSDNKSIAKHFIEDLWGKGDLNVADEVLAANYTRHNPQNPVHGPAEYKQLVKKFHDVIVGLKLEVKEIAAEGSNVCVLYSVSGTLKGEVPGFNKHAGDTFQGIGLDFLKFADGKIQESWPSFEIAGGK
jgi:predicted SnoaL-like aldol condensation-catalyzing enzyme